MLKCCRAITKSEGYVLELKKTLVLVLGSGSALQPGLTEDYRLPWQHMLHGIQQGFSSGASSINHVPPSTGWGRRAITSTSLLGGMLMVAAAHTVGRVVRDVPASVKDKVQLQLPWRSSHQWLLGAS